MKKEIERKYNMEDEASSQLFKASQVDNKVITHIAF